MDQVALFLHEMKAIVEERGFILVPRKGSLQFLADLEVTPSQLKDVLLSLSPRDCFDGPEADRDPRFADKWTVAEFSPEAFGVKLYLKVSIRTDKRACKCLSVKIYRDRREAEDGR